MFIGITCVSPGKVFRNKYKGVIVTPADTIPIRKIPKIRYMICLFICLQTKNKGLKNEINLY
jgi:hypothetical protein